MALQAVGLAARLAMIHARPKDLTRNRDMAVKPSQTTAWWVSVPRFATEAIPGTWRSKCIELPFQSQMAVLASFMA